jgi:hypothetical protein
MVIHQIGTAVYRRYLDEAPHTRDFEIVVQQLEGTVSAHFVCAMQIDADGSPWGYHPSDKSEALKQNSTMSYDWSENLNSRDRHGIQGQDGYGPATNYIVSGTTLENENEPSTKSTNRYINAADIPYFVLPSSLPLPLGSAPPGEVSKHVGCLGYIVDLETGHASGAIFADIGPRVGEASIKLALRLGRNPQYPKVTQFPPSLWPKVSAIDSKRFFYLIFPNQRKTAPLKVDDIEDSARALFSAWGGWTMLAAALKKIPHENPPGAEGDDIADIKLPPEKGPAQKINFRKPDLYVVASEKGTQLLAAPSNGKKLGATRAVGTVEVIHRIAGSAWWRVVTTVDGQVLQGYVHSDDLRPK